MHRLRLVLVAATLMVSLFMGSGIASAGIAWNDSVGPATVDVGTDQPAPEFKVKLGK